MMHPSMKSMLALCSLIGLVSATASIQESGEPDNDFSLSFYDSIFDTNVDCRKAKDKSQNERHEQAMDLYTRLHRGTMNNDKDAARRLLWDPPLIERCLHFGIPENLAQEGLWGVVGLFNDTMREPGDRELAQATDPQFMAPGYTPLSFEARYTMGVGGLIVSEEWHSSIFTSGLKTLKPYPPDETTALKIAKDTLRSVCYALPGTVNPTQKGALALSLALSKSEIMTEETDRVAVNMWSAGMNLAPVIPRSWDEKGPQRHMRCMWELYLVLRARRYDLNGKGGLFKEEAPVECSIPDADRGLCSVS